MSCVGDMMSEHQIRRVVLPKTRETYEIFDIHMRIDVFPMQFFDLFLLNMCVAVCCSAVQCVAVCVAVL